MEVAQRLSCAAKEDTPPSPPINGQAALSELLAHKASAYVESGALSIVANYVPDLVSWPQSAGRACSVDCLPEEERAILTVGSDRLFRPAGEFEGGVESCSIKVYWDDLLRKDGTAYLDLLVSCTDVT